MEAGIRRLALPNFSGKLASRDLSFSLRDHSEIGEERCNKINRCLGSGKSSGISTVG